jgi:hypothetical protein
MMGLNIDIASTIGGMLADQYIGQLTPWEYENLNGLYISRFIYNSFSLW